MDRWHDVMNVFFLKRMILSVPLMGMKITKWDGKRRLKDRRIFALLRLLGLQNIALYRIIDFVYGGDKTNQQTRTLENRWKYCFKFNLILFPTSHSNETSDMAFLEIFLFLFMFMFLLLFILSLRWAIWAKSEAIFVVIIEWIKYWLITNA